MSRRPKITTAALAVMLAMGASAWAPAQTTSSGAQKDQGSQLLPEAQPPFVVKSDMRPTQPSAAQGAEKFAAQPLPSAATENAGSGSGTQFRPAQCDYNFCAGKYRSFDASNCTYQPYTGGPRRLCER